MIGYIVALLPLYIFVYLPVSNILFGTAPKPSQEVFHLNSSFIASNEPLYCPSHKYSTHILSLEPLVIYIESFVSSDESSHLLKIRLDTNFMPWRPPSHPCSCESTHVTDIYHSEDKFEPSTVSTGADTSIQKTIRHSEVALIDRDDMVRCIEHRARSFQGWRPDLHIERLRTQRYGQGGHYVHHYDWSGANRKADRVSTFMVYVDADCDGGGTEFPRIPMPDVADGKWCRFLECKEGEIDGKKPKMGVTFKPMKGNAVFWENLRPDGRGYEETWHAGLPLLSGTKVGLNIWSWGPARRN